VNTPSEPAPTQKFSRKCTKSTPPMHESVVDTFIYSNERESTKELTRPVRKVFILTRRSWTRNYAPPAFNTTAWSRHQQYYDCQHCARWRGCLPYQNRSNRSSFEKGFVSNDLIWPGVSRRTNWANLRGNYPKILHFELVALAAYGQSSPQAQRCSLRCVDYAARTYSRCWWDTRRQWE